MGKQEKREKKLTSQQVTLQVLGVQVRFGTVRARELAIRVLHGNDGALGSTSAGLRRSRATGSTGKDATAALRAHDVGGLVAIRHGLLHQASVTVGRLNAGLRHDAAGRHGTQVRRDPATRGSRRDGLRVSRSQRGLGHHTRSGRVALRRRRIAAGHLVRSAASTLSAMRRVVGHVSAITAWVVVGRAMTVGVGCRGGIGRIGRGRRARRVRVAAVHLIHRGGRLRLQRRKGMLGLREGRIVLGELVRSDGRRWGRV